MTRSISHRNDVIYNLHEFNVSVTSREIFLNTIDDEIDHRTANTFLKNMTLLENENQNTILIHLCTCGGDFYYGLAIYDRIKASPCRVIVLAYAHARSMSSLIPLAADCKIIAPSATYMIHHGTVELNGETLTVISDAEQTKVEIEQMLNIYIEACKTGSFFKGWSVKRIRTFLMKKLESNWYLSSRAAVKYGFMDAVLGDPGFETIGALK